MTEPGEIVPAIHRAIRQTEEGTPALLEFITAKEIDVSTFKYEPVEVAATAQAT